MDTWLIVSTLITGIFLGFVLTCAGIYLLCVTEDRKKAQKRKQLNIKETVMAYDSSIHHH